MNKRITENKKEELKVKYFASKVELDKIRSDATLAKWKVLSKNYKLGKKIWGHHFTREKLAQDMEMPYTTCLRCLSLDKANANSWKKHKAGKISTFKLAMICHQKSINFQDELVDMVIKDNLSTYEISELRINIVEDINKERHKIAVQQGYSRKSSAAEQFQRWINRGKLFLLMKDKALTKTKQKEIKTQLKELNKRIEWYCNEKEIRE
jgi:hypothetical protein